MAPLSSPFVTRPLIFSTRTLTLPPVSFLFFFACISTRPLPLWFGGVNGRLVRIYLGFGFPEVFRFKSSHKGFGG